MSGLLGPQGANARLQELQAKIDSFAPPAPTNSSGSFQSTLAGVLPVSPSQFNVTPDQGALGALGAMADAAATRNGVDPKVFRALVGAESNWNPGATSRVGAKGLCQLMPGTAQALGVADPDDPQQSLEGGAKYLRQMLDQFGGNYSKALAAYNAGPGAVQKAGGIPPFQETVAYVRKILSQAGGST